MATGTITNTITDPSGTTLQGIVATARLRPCPGVRISDSSEVGPVETATTNASGVYSLVLEQNSNILPANSWWEIEEDVPVTIAGGPTTRIWCVRSTAGSHVVGAVLITGQL